MKWSLPVADTQSLEMSADVFERTDDRMQQYVEDGFVAGIVTVQARHGKIAHTSVHGMLNIDQSTALGYDSIFRMYSNSKLICAVAVMQLYERGYFQLREALSTYLPAFDRVRISVDNKLQAPQRPITIHDLLVHLGGLSYDLVHQAKKERWSHDEFIERFVECPLLSEPGQQWNYSASNDILGILVEKVSGKPLDVYLKEEIFEPLGMIDTDFYVPIEKHNRFGPAYAFTDSGLVESDNLNADSYLEKPSFFSLGGGLVSTASDYLTFSQMLLNGWSFNGCQILSRKSVELIRSDHLPVGHPDIDINKMRYGLSVEVLTDLGRTQRLGSVGEFGWGGAACTQVWIDPLENKISLILMQLFGGKAPILNTFLTMSNAALL